MQLPCLYRRLIPFLFCARRALHFVAQTWSGVGVFRKVCHQAEA